MMSLNIIIRQLAIFIIITISMLIACIDVYAWTFFQERSTWTEPIPENPTIHSESAQVINDFVSNAKTIFINDHQTPVYIADAEAEVHPTLVQIEGCETGSEKSCSEIDLNIWTQGWNVVPIPSNAKTINNDIACNGTYADNIMLIYNQDKTESWHLYHAKKCNGVWSTSIVRKWINTNDGVEDSAGPLTYTANGNPQPRYDNLGAPSASKKPINHGLLTYDEVYNDEIDHALSFTWNGSRKSAQSYWGVYPAVAYVNGIAERPYAPITGMRFQLNMTVEDIEAYVANKGLSKYHKRVLIALKKYGMFFIDSWGDYNVGITAENLTYSRNSHGGNKGWGDIFTKNGSWDTSFPGLSKNKFRVIEPLRPPFSKLSVYQCSDGFDNDNDNLIDYPSDPGCASPTDNDETKDSILNDDYNYIVNIDPVGTYLEAENFTGTINQGAGLFVKESTQSSHLGTGYLESTSGGLGSGCPSNYEGKEYLVNFIETGTYNVWLRGYATDNSEDSIFIGFDGNCVGALEETVYSQWSWTNNIKSGTNTINVTTAGLHTLNIWIRESNHLTDGIYLTQGTETPDDVIVLLDSIPPAPPEGLIVN